MKVAQSCLTLCDPMDSPWNSPGQNTRWPFPSPGDLPNPGMEPKSPPLQPDSLTAEPLRNSIVGSDGAWETVKHRACAALALTYRPFRMQSSEASPVAQW